MPEIELGKEFVFNGKVYLLTKWTETKYNPPPLDVYLFEDRLDVSHHMMQEVTVTIEAREMRTAETVS